MQAQAAEEARPAGLMERATLLEGLFQHYPAQPVGDGLKQFLKDWHEDTGHLPLHVLAETCRKVRRSNRSFRPTPGQFLAEVDPAWSVPLKAAEAAIKALEDIEKSLLTTSDRGR